MNLKTLFIIASVVMVACVAALIYFFGFRDPKQDTQNNNIQYQIQALPSPTIEPGEFIKLTIGSETLTVKNFIANSEKIVENVVYLSENPNYSILYFSNSNNFLISLYAYTTQDANTFRSAAEQELMSKLGIGPETACKLNISTTIPNSYNTDLSSTDYKFSYCENGIEISELLNPTESNSQENLR